MAHEGALLSIFYVPESTEEEKEENKSLLEIVTPPSECFSTEVKNIFEVFFSRSEMHRHKMNHVKVNNSVPFGESHCCGATTSTCF